MIKLPKMLLIGASVRNVGKTEFACRLIKRFSASGRIVGLKVTVIRERDGRCPRGGTGCGVCSSLSEGFCITRENNASTDKDTSKMLRSGASAVYWLRVMQESIREGLSSLLRRVDTDSGSDSFIVCESNSIRKVVEPGLFFVLNRAGNTNMKKSCQEVMMHADRLVTMLPEKNDFDIDMERIGISDGSWGLLEDASAVILSGGRSSRMGEDKAMLELSGRPLIEHVAIQLRPNFREIIVGTDSVGKYDFLECRRVIDKEKGKGPLMGVYSCLQESSSDKNFVTACDVPEISMPFVRMMLAMSDSCDAVVPRHDNGMIEPLFAVYRKSAIPVLRKALEPGGDLKIMNLFDKINVGYVSVPGYLNLMNINTKEEYLKFTTDIT